jgi:hypothetical protein
VSWKVNKATKGVKRPAEAGTPALGAVVVAVLVLFGVNTDTAAKAAAASMAVAPFAITYARDRKWL